MSVGASSSSMEGARDCDDASFPRARASADASRGLARSEQTREMRAEFASAVARGVECAVRVRTTERARSGGRSRVVVVASLARANERARDDELGTLRACSRRRALAALGVGAIGGAAATRARYARAEDGTSGLAPYADAKKAFTLGYPSTWTVGSKPGAEVLFKDPAAKYSNIGVTVSPVTVSDLSKFGSLENIGDRLAKAEQAKESTVPGGVSLTNSRERVGKVSGTTFYDYEYRLITTYGNKRIYTSVTIVDSTLYILNAQVYETADPERPTKEQLDADALNLALYRTVADSFDAGKKAFTS